MARCVFFIPQTGEIAAAKPRSNYKTWRVPAEKRAFLEGWVEAADVGPHGLQYPPGFLRALPVLAKMCRRRR